MNELVKRFISYILSLINVTIILIYVLDLPGYLTGANNLVKEYYYKNAVSSFILDIVLVALYISAAMYVTTYFGNLNNALELLIVSATSALISTIFLFVFKTGFAKGSFFHRWFKQVGFLAVMYDVLLVSSVFVLMKIIYKRL